MPTLDETNKAVEITEKAIAFITSRISST